MFSASLQRRLRIATARAPDSLLRRLAIKIRFPDSPALRRVAASKCQRSCITSRSFPDLFIPDLFFPDLFPIFPPDLISSFLAADGSRSFPDLFPIFRSRSFLRPRGFPISSRSLLPNRFGARGGT